jgi:hypothetical protein
LWLSTLACAVTLAALPAAAGQGQGKDEGKAHRKADHPHADGKQKQKIKDKAAKRADREAAKHEDERTRFRGLDRNNDGTVSRGEWDGNRGSFADHDWNRDGVLSGAEIDPGAARPPARAAARDAAGAPSPAAVPAAKPRTESDEVLFARRDTNNDRRISRAEWTLDAKTFDRLDANKDGWLSPYEFGIGR